MAAPFALLIAWAILTSSVVLGGSGAAAGNDGKAAAFGHHAQHHPPRFSGSAAVLAGWRSAVAAGEPVAEAAAAMVWDDERSWRARQGGRTASALLARFNQVSLRKTPDKDLDLCDGAFQGLMEQRLPPIDLGSPGASPAIVAGQRFPQWQPVGRPAVPQPGVWASVEEVRVSVPERAVLAEGWTSVEQFFASWPSDLRAVPRGHGAAGFASRMVPDRLGPSPLAVRPGAVLRCDLPTVGGRGVELADFEITDVQSSRFRLASLAVVGPDDGIVYRHPFCGVWELGFFRGPRDKHDPESTDRSVPPVREDAVTFYVRSVTAPDGPGVRDAGMHVAREAWAGFVQGVAERFGAAPDAAASALRGIGGSADEFYTFVKDEPECYEAPSGSATPDHYDPTDE